MNSDLKSESGKIQSVPEELDEIVEELVYYSDAVTPFKNTGKVLRPLLISANKHFNRINRLLRTSPAFIEMIQATVPEETFRAILTDKQKEEIAKGALKLMTKKDGSLMANLVDPNTGKIFHAITLEKIKLTPELTESIVNYTQQMQLAQIGQSIQEVQAVIEEVHQGQENDRLAAAYSCQQKFIQCMAIKKHELRTEALIRLASDAEDSRNLLMLSQASNVKYIADQPESFFEKLLHGDSKKKIDSRMNEIRDSLNAINTVSLIEAMCYHELGEPDAARQSLGYYSDFIQKTYLSSDGLVERLDSIDPSPINYWSESLPDIQNKIQTLPGMNSDDLIMLIEEGDQDNE